MSKPCTITAAYESHQDRETGGWRGVKEVAIPDIHVQVEVTYDRGAHEQAWQEFEKAVAEVRAHFEELS